MKYLAPGIFSCQWWLSSEYKTRKYEEYELPCPNQLLKTGKASKGEGIRTLIQCREIAAAID